jgi:hypothetical protein
MSSSASVDGEFTGYRDVADDRQATLGVSHRVIVVAPCGVLHHGQSPL